MDISEKQKRLLEGGELKFISQRWNGKTQAKEWNAHVFGDLDPADCPMCVRGEWPRHGELARRPTITMENGSTITGEKGEGRIKGRSGDILWWNDEFRVEDEHGNHRWEAIVPRSLLTNTEFDQSER